MIHVMSGIAKSASRLSWKRSWSENSLDVFFYRNVDKELTTRICIDRPFSNVNCSSLCTTNEVYVGIAFTQLSLEILRVSLQVILVMLGREIRLMLCSWLENS